MNWEPCTKSNQIPGLGVVLDQCFQREKLKVTGDFPVLGGNPKGWSQEETQGEKQTIKFTFKQVKTALNKHVAFCKGG